MYNGKVKVFTGSSNKPLAQHIASLLHVDLSPLEIHVFPDGERRVRVEENVLDQEVIVVESTNTPVDQNYMELFFIVDALKRSGATSITAVVPYLGYQRQDHVFREGEAVSLAVVIKMLETAGVNEIITLDLHSIKIPEFFSIPIVHLSALPLFAKKIRELETSDGQYCIVSPDMGGIRRIKILSELLDNMSFVTINKNRDLVTGEISSKEFEGEIKNTSFIVDDMASSGKTLVEAAKLLKEKGAASIYAFVTHAIFSEDAPKLLQESDIKKIFVTDSVYVPKKKQFPKLTIVSTSHMIVEKLNSS